MPKDRLKQDLTESVIRIGKRIIGGNNPTFIVAELSGNHHKNYDEAVGLIRAAAQSGADAVKLQTYTPDTMTIDSKKRWFTVGGAKNPKTWKGKSLYKLYREAYTPWDWQPKLKKIADSLGLLFFSTPFDETAVDFLEGIKVPCYKISSYEATDIPLLKRVARTLKPVILSVGFANLSEINQAVETLRKNGCSQIALLHCVTAYSDVPDLERMNLHTINELRTRFNVVSGFSDNNAGIEVPLYSVAMGASIVEKHFILNRDKGGPDAQFSIEPVELAQLVKTIRNFEKAKGIVHYGPADSRERYNKRFRRSIFVVADIKKDDKFSADNVRVIRPEFGLSPSMLGEVIGKQATKDIKRGTPLNSKMVSK